MFSFKNIGRVVLLLACLFFTVGYYSPLYLKEASSGLEIDSSPVFIELFFHNLKVNLYCVVFSPITLGIYALIYLVLNFFSMGLIVSHLRTEHTWLDALSTFVIHGIFEVPAMLLSAAVGFYIPSKVVLMILKKKVVVEEIKKIVYFVAIIIVLTFIAAIVETFVSPHFIRI